MANKKFSAFTNQAMTASSELVGFDGGANTRYDITQLKEGLGIGRFMLQAGTDAPFSGGSGAETYYSWHGGQKGSGSSISFGGFYAPANFKIIKASIRYEGQTANPVLLTGAESATFNIAKLDTPNAANSNQSAKTNFADATAFYQITAADNGTWPLVTHTFASPLQVTAGDIILLYSVESGTVTPTSADIGVFLDCQYT